MNQILVINPGSTSTKIAWYCDQEKKWGENLEHDPALIKQYSVIYDQLEMRTEVVLDTIAKKRGGHPLSQRRGQPGRPAGPGQCRCL